MLEDGPHPSPYLLKQPSLFERCVRAVPPSNRRLKPVLLPPALEEHQLDRGVGRSAGGGSHYRGGCRSVSARAMCASRVSARRSRVSERALCHHVAQRVPSLRLPTRSVPERDIRRCVVGPYARIGVGGVVGGCSTRRCFSLRPEGWASRHSCCESFARHARKARPATRGNGDDTSAACVCGALRRLLAVGREAPRGGRRHGWSRAAHVVGPLGVAALQP